MTSRLGPHSIHTTVEAIGWAGRAPIAKQMDGTAVLATAHPNSVRIFRHFFPDQRLDGDLGQLARDVANAILDGLGGYRHPLLYAEVYNEIPGADWRRYAALLQRVVPLLHAAGVKVAGPCWGTGDYEAEAWEGFRALGWCGLDLIALHAYWSTAGPTIWNGLRWRQFWQPGDPPVVVTECGRDQVRDGPGGTLLPHDGPGDYGWQAQGVDAEAFLLELENYDALIESDPYVLGATPFTLGPTDDWRRKGFDLDPLAADLARLSVPRTSPSVVVVVPPPPKEAPMRLGLLYRMGADVPEASIDEVTVLCQRGGFSVISPKAMDGDAWEGTFDNDPNLAIKNAADLQAQALAYHQRGIDVEPWVVYRGFDAGAEATAHATVGRICRTLIVDFEWRYPGFADKGGWDDAVRYFRLLREGAPGVRIVFCPDPRQVRRGEYQVADVLPFVDVVSPQVYWTDFQRPWGEVLAEGLFADYGGTPVWPMVPGNSSPADLDAALTRLLGEAHAPGLATAYVFQRVGLAEANLAVLKKYSELGGITLPTEEESEMPLLNVDKDRYEADYWAPLYRRQQEDAAMVAKLRATGHHADALLADAIERAAGVLQPTVSLHKVVCGAEAA